MYLQLIFNMCFIEIKCKWITFRIISVWSGELSFTCCRYSASRLTAYRKTWLWIAGFRWWLFFEFLNQVVQWFCRICSADPKESATGSQVIRGFIFVMTTLKLSYSLHVINNFISNISDISLIGHRFISYDCYSTYLRTPCTHYGNHTYFNEGQIMQCLVVYSNDMYSYLFKIISEI